MPNKKDKTVMIRVFPDDAAWINAEAKRLTKEARLRHTQYSVVHQLIIERFKLKENNS